MIRQSILITDLVLSVVAVIVAIQKLSSSPLELVATLERGEAMDVAVSQNGRMFVAIASEPGGHGGSIAEVLPNGQVHPFPNDRWNSRHEKSTSPATHRFIHVNSIEVDADNMLWALDAGSRDGGVVAGGAKLVKVNLYTSQVERIILLDDCVAPRDSMLVDLQIDSRRQVAYLADASLGSIVTVDLASGMAQRHLCDHPSTKADPVLIASSHRASWASRGAAHPHVNALALSADGTHLYYKAMFSRTLYRIPTAALQSNLAGDSDAGRAPERIAETALSGDLYIDERGRLYHAALEHNAVLRLTPERKLETVVKDDRLQRPRGMAMRHHLGGQQLYFVTAATAPESGESNGASAIFTLKISDAAVASAY